MSGYYGTMLLASITTIALGTGMYHFFFDKNIMDSIYWFFVETDSYLWWNLGIVNAVFFSVAGAAVGIWTTGSTIMGAGVKAPHIKTKNLISIIFCEAVAIYGLVIAILMTTSMPQWKIDYAGDIEILNKLRHGGYVAFGCGTIVGVANLCCGAVIGVVGSGTALADASNPSLFVKILLFEIFASIIGIYGLIVGVFLTSKLPTL
ncbi:hypothetical protein HCN44_006395 [Aphidius gifuensis]|uniref:V-type proton ATPase 16 kDa proteolipid subunit c n=1 Tax=Aphidius gifuensis TaxID=684658 RepID=A0A835CUG7_APHGI|nr:V-type proton ATPase 21 kDa proteolipid subunit-like [Aphidius gifuensis]KAF7993335.1 hypothetical protein HCN44_006395 [Aphidius gifuensis]